VQPVAFSRAMEENIRRSLIPRGAEGAAIQGSTWKPLLAPSLRKAAKPLGVPLRSCPKS
jgi:hypothetical protein